MGLAGPKKSTKIGNDPNNTKWTNDKSSFGHKMMISQGWQPGQYLGAIDAPHAEFHTAANASHIRVSIKDDNLGLGAKIGSGVGHGECTGLDAFKNLLGRLNGKEQDEIEQEQKSRDDLRRAIYSERKWGSIRFVPGGFLIGDKIEHLIEAEAERIQKLALGGSSGSNSDSSDTSSDEESEEEAPAPAPVEKHKKSKKRKIEVVEEEKSEAPIVKTKKSKKRKVESGSEDAGESTTVSEDKPKSEKKKSKKDHKPKVEKEEDIPSEKELKKRAKKEKKEKKERRKERKEKSTSADPDEGEKEHKKKKKSKRDKEKAIPELISDTSESSRVNTKESTPSTPLPGSGRSTPMLQGRHAVRSRNIAQKRLAAMDVASLNQIFMIKSQ